MRVSHSQTFPSAISVSVLSTVSTTFTNRGGGVTFSVPLPAFQCHLWKANNLAAVPMHWKAMLRAPKRCLERLSGLKALYCSIQHVVHFQAFFRIKHKVVGSCLSAECSPHGFQSVSLVKRLSLWLYWDGYFLCNCHHSITSNGTSGWKAVCKTGRPSQGQRFGQVVKWPRSQGPLREPIIFHPKTQVRG